MQEPLLLGDAASLLNINEHDLTKYANKISAMFPLIESDNGQKMFSIYHKSVTDFLTTKASECVRYPVADKMLELDFSISVIDANKLFADRMLRQIANYTNQNSDLNRIVVDTISDYSVQHLLTHLDASGRGEEAKRFLFSLPWLHAVAVRRGVAELHKEVRKRAESDGELTLFMKTLGAAAAAQV
jgi:hypothetical protein